MKFSERFGPASAQFEGDRLEVSTGRVRRTWRVLSNGLSTVSLVETGQGTEWIAPRAEAACDWHLFGINEEGAPCVLTGVSRRRVENDPSDADHLAVEAAFSYPESKLLLSYQIRVYPDAPGTWTRIAVQSTEAIVPGAAWRLPSWLLGSFGERLAVDAEARERIAFGYYNDTQHRYHADLPILKEERRRGPVGRREVHDWASGLALQSPEGRGPGLLLVKESHKCVNQDGLDTGAFVLHAGEVRSTGLGLAAHYDKSYWVSHDRPRAAWANWCVLYHGGDGERGLALKEFDRARFPFRPRRDALIMANPWGSHGLGDEARAAAEQSIVLQEIDSCSDLGIDSLQIDDGWQCDGKVPDYKVVDWLPSPVRFPDGWEAVRARARDRNVALGLWFAWFAPNQKIIENHRRGGFTKFKLDFSHVTNREDLDKLVGQAREVIAGTDPEVSVNWDVTEQVARVGYYYAREYGNLFLQNCEFAPPGFQYYQHICYTPWLTLRQAWHLARYMNLNQVQITVHNVDQTPAAYSNAHLYGHAYCFAIAMMGVPLFFQETRHLDARARRELKPLVSLYKAHRREILSGYVFPLGGEPDDAGFTGFQCRLPGGAGGYLTVFREIGAKADRAALELPFLEGKRIAVEDLIEGGACEAAVGADGRLSFHLPKPASFRFLKYRVL